MKKKTQSEVDIGWILTAMLIMKEYCKLNPTCEHCRFKNKHKGCYFREGKTPREWEI